ncbi:I78 family peptidase inhibitor [Variovorax dokdonensis]|uniref:I78 family peptidase inhibitor n=1 Tax=Variovorax dokdonensis TaxID=344883 RepID=A0ABT7NDM8_9BURK|nr:I78 family peptidase inhibitor [Variovorax dokdonensis]MDM0046038.1 I78 family peptidase inhibitor [Variovorax dokdonensis]
MRRSPNSAVDVPAQEGPCSFVVAHLAGMAALVGMTMLAGCAAPPPSERPLGPQLPPPPEMVKVERRCDATQARFALGQAIDNQMLEQARDRTGADQAVTVRSGQAMPTPPDPLRLILEVDPQGKMVGARCG